jgi:hypothetical protein
MRSDLVARLFFGLTSLVVGFGLVLQLSLSVTAKSGAGSFESTSDRVVNFFSFFTVLSNVGVVVTTGLLALTLARTSTAFRTIRLDAVLGIAVTGIVFHLTLADLQELTGWESVADFILHTLSPIVAVLGWLVLGPRRMLSVRVVWLSVVVPILWLAYALVRGALVDDRFGHDYYAYPFMNVQRHGYPTVLVNVSLVAILFLALSFGALALDRRLPARPPAASV